MVKLNLPVRGETDALLINNGYEIPVALHNSIAAVCAGENGSITVWEDLDDKIHCEVSRNLLSIEKKVFEEYEVDQVIEWADEWIEKIS